MMFVFLALAIAACIGWTLHARTLRCALYKAWAEIDALESHEQIAAPPASEAASRVNGGSFILVSVEIPSYTGATPEQGAAQLVLAMLYSSLARSNVAAAYRLLGRDVDAALGGAIGLTPYDLDRFIHTLHQEFTRDDDVLALQSKLRDLRAISLTPYHLDRFIHALHQEVTRGGDDVLALQSKLRDLRATVRRIDGVLVLIAIPGQERPAAPLVLTLLREGFAQGDVNAKLGAAIDLTPDDIDHLTHALHHEAARIDVAWQHLDAKLVDLRAAIDHLVSRQQETP